MSGGSPSTSLRTTEYTRAGAQRRANRPPFTAESRLRTVFISTMSAPEASSRPVMSCSSPALTRGSSNRALPPPDSRNRTVSSSPRSDTSASASRVARKEFSSGTGWPASRQRTPGMGPATWPYLVMTMPLSTASPRHSRAVLAICQAAFPAATSTTRPGKVLPSRARRTASSGRTAAMARSMI